MASERSLRILSGQVYTIDSKSGDYNAQLKKGEVVNLGGTEYYILQIKDNTNNGMQAMAVAPVIDEKVDTSEIVIAYAGTNAKDMNDIKTDIQTVVGKNKEYMTERQRIPYTTTFITVPVKSQITSAETFAKNIHRKYPNAEIITTGHSLGEYIALYIAAENKWKNIGFNGPDPYEILSTEAQKWVTENPGMYYNYRNKEDKIGNYGGNGTGAEILVDMNMGRHIKDTLAFHGLNSWKFDQDGELLIEATKENKEARQKRAEKIINVKMSELTILSKKLKASGRGLSRSEVIFLDNTKAFLAVDYISKSMKIGLEAVIEVYEEAITEAEETWDKGIELAKAIGTELSYSEIIDALQTRGVTKHAVVWEPTAYYRQKISEALEIGEKFDRLALQIKQGIQKLEETDKELADQIEEGVQIIG